MKFDPSKLSTAAKAWTAKHGKFVFPGIVSVFVLAVIVVNVRPHFARGSDSPKAATATATAPATRVAQATAAPSAPNTRNACAHEPCAPSIAQQAVPAVTAPAVAAVSAAPIPVAAPIQPPAGIQRGYIVEKRYQEDQFGTQVLIATNVVGVQAVSLQAPSTDTGFSGPATSVEWSAWINLTKPASLAWVRLAGGQGTVTATIDGVRLGEPVEHWQTSGPTSSMSSVALAAGWHQIEVHDDRAHWVNGPGVAVRIDFGDGASDPVSPQPWAVPAGGAAAGPQVAQKPAAATVSTASPRASQSPISSNAAAVPAATTAAGGAK